MATSMRAIIAIFIAFGIAGCYRSRAQGAEPAASDCTVNPQTTAVIDLVASVSAPAGGFIPVVLEDGETYFFDASDPSSEIYAGIVESRRSRGEPIYLEYMLDTRMIVDIGMPVEYLVLTITETAVGAQMTFEVSAAIHPLSRTLPCYDTFLEDLRTALDRGTTVWVTHDSSYAIVDVRPAW